MRLKLKEKILSASPIFLMLEFWFARVAYAVGHNCSLNESDTDFGCLPTDPVGFVQKFYAWGLGFLAFVGVLFMIIGGYFIMTSRGSPEQMQKGKSFIFYAIAGILLAVLGFVFIEIVAGQILKIPGFS